MSCAVPKLVYLRRLERGSTLQLQTCFCFCWQRGTSSLYFFYPPAHFECNATKEIASFLSAMQAVKIWSGFISLIFRQFLWPPWKNISTKKGNELPYPQEPESPSRAELPGTRWPCWTPAFGAIPRWKQISDVGNISGALISRRSANSRRKWCHNNTKRDLTESFAKICIYMKLEFWTYKHHHDKSCGQVCRRRSPATDKMIVGSRDNISKGKKSIVLTRSVTLKMK